MATARVSTRVARMAPFECALGLCVRVGGVSKMKTKVWVWSAKVRAHETQADGGENVAHFCQSAAFFTFAVSLLYEISNAPVSQRTMKHASEPHASVVVTELPRMPLYIGGGRCFGVWMSVCAGLLKGPTRITPKVWAAPAPFIDQPVSIHQFPTQMSTRSSHRACAPCLSDQGGNV